jgi:hypothetical protein
MPLRFRSLIPAVVLLAACGTEPPPPGVLAILLDSVPPAVAATTLSLTGTVTRTPALAVPITVHAAGGVQPVEVAASASGAFSLDVGLTPNTVSSITVTADDSTGSTSDARTVQVRQDSRAPTVVSLSPADKASNVSPGQPIVVTFDEPIDPSYLSLASLRRGGLPLQGIITVAADSLTMTITPDVAAAGALYQVIVTGMHDALGNVQIALARGCYTTAPPPGASSITDPQDDVYYAGQVGGITPSDFLGASFSLTGSMLDVLLRFTTARAVRASGANALFAALDLDYDRSQATGYRPIKDIAFEGVLPSSGAGADYGIFLTQFAQLGDSSLFGQYTAEGTVQVVGAFVPDTCGNRVGFTLDNGLLGAPLTFNLVGYFETADANGAFGDAGPDSGVYPVTLPTAVPGLGGAPSAEARRTDRIVRLPRPHHLR